MPCCPKCRTTVGTNDKSCSECGAALKKGAAYAETGEVYKRARCLGVGTVSTGFFKSEICPVCEGKGIVRV